MTTWVALVTLLSLIFYLVTGVQVGRARGRLGVAAPAMTGHPEFERLVRVQANTLEWLVVYLPSLWLFAAYVEPRVAAGLGAVWIVGRLIYARAYAKDPGTRTTGFLVQALSTSVLLVGALVGVTLALIHRGG